MVEVKYKSWKELPIGVYFKIKGLETEGLDIDIAIEKLALLCNCDSDILRGMPMAKLLAMSKSIEYLHTEIPKHKLNKVVVRGVTYKVMNNPSDLTAAQYIDFDTFKTDVQKYYSNILAVILIPEGYKYGIGYDPVEVGNIFMEDLDVETAESVCFFFMNSSRKSTSRALAKLIRTMGRMAMKTRGKIRENHLLAMKELVKEKELIDGCRL